jgi:hypothetical protein
VATVAGQLQYTTFVAPGQQLWLQEVPPSLVDRELSSTGYTDESLQQSGQALSIGWGRFWQVSAESSRSGQTDP